MFFYQIITVSFMSYDLQRSVSADMPDIDCGYNIWADLPDWHSGTSADGDSR